MIKDNKLGIRKGTMNDVGEIARLLHEYDLYENKLDKNHKIDRMSEIISFNKKLMKNPKVVYFVIDDGNKLQGIISGEWRNVAVGKNASFHNIFVSEEARKKGYGRKLLNKLELYFKNKGCKKIQSFVFMGNKKAVGFYKKLGYKYAAGFDIEKRLK